MRYVERVPKPPLPRIEEPGSVLIGVKLVKSNQAFTQISFQTVRGGTVPLLRKRSLRGMRRYFFTEKVFKNEARRIGADKEK